MCVSRRPVKKELFILRQLSRIDCSEFLSWSICAIDVGLSSCVSGRLAMAASLLRTMMCFMKIRVCPFAVYAANLASPQLNAVLLLYSRQCAEVCELRMRYRDLFEGMFKTLCAFAPSSSEFIPFLACLHSITDFEINAFQN